MGLRDTPTVKCSAREIKFFLPLFGKKTDIDKRVHHIVCAKNLSWNKKLKRYRWPCHESSKAIKINFRRLKLPRIRLDSRTIAPKGASALEPRPNVVPDQAFETNINFLHQLEKDLRKTFQRKWKFPSDDQSEENRKKVCFITLCFCGFLTSVRFYRGWHDT